MQQAGRLNPYREVQGGDIDADASLGPGRSATGATGLNEEASLALKLRQFRNGVSDLRATTATGAIDIIKALADEAGHQNGNPSGIGWSLGLGAGGGGFGK